MSIAYQYTLLFVDDDEIIRTNYSAGLQKDFPTVYLASNGQEAFEIYTHKNIDIIISDLDMPIMDGVALVQKIRQTNKKIPIILLTSYSDSQTLLSVVDQKITAYLIKPIKKLELKSALKKAINELDIKEHIIHLSSPYYWDTSLLELKHPDHQLSLTLKERELLVALFKNINTSVSYEILQTLLWNEVSTKTLNRLKTVVKNIRRKIDVELISNHYAVGYSICI